MGGVDSFGYCANRCKGSHGGARQRAGRRRLHVAAYQTKRPLSANSPAMNFFEEGGNSSEMAKIHAKLCTVQV